MLLWEKRPQSKVFTGRSSFSPQQDGQAMLWDLNEGKHLYTLDGGDHIRSMCFSPNRYWLCAATGPSIKIWVSYEDIQVRMEFAVAQGPLGFFLTQS